MGHVVASCSQLRHFLYHVPIEWSRTSLLRLPRCYLKLVQRSLYSWECDLCQSEWTAHSLETHYSCAFHSVDVCLPCYRLRCAAGTPCISPPVAEIIPFDSCGRPTLYPEEWAAYQRPSGGHLTQQLYRHQATSIVRLFFVADARVAFVVRALFYRLGDGAYIAAGTLTEADKCSPGSYGALSDVWYRDPLSVKSLTCSACGTTEVSAYFCPDPVCYHSLCFQCYSRRKWPGEPSTNFPHRSRIGLPLPASTCSLSVPHGPLAGQPDLSYVLSPFHFVGVYGPSTDDPTMSVREHFASLHGGDYVFNIGAGVFPHRISLVNRSASADVVTPAIKAVCDSIRSVRSDSLVITVNGHGGQFGYVFGDITYSASQLLDGVLLPIVEAFRTTHGRMGRPRVLVYFNICDVNPHTWATLIADHPSPEHRFEFLAFSRPAKHVDIPLYLGQFLRYYLNEVCRVQRSYTIAQCFAMVVSPYFELAAGPFVISFGSAPIVEFASIVAAVRDIAVTEASISAGSVASTAASCVAPSPNAPASSSGVVPSSPAYCATDACSARSAPESLRRSQNVLLLSFLRSLSSSGIYHRRLTNVNVADLLLAVNLVCDNLFGVGSHTPRSGCRDGIKLFGEWARTNGWRFSPSIGYIWSALP